MKKIIALCTLCLFLNTSAQEEVNPGPAVESTEQDAQPIESAEEVIEETIPTVPTETPNEETEIDENEASDLGPESSSEDDGDEKWYDFSEQKNKIQERQDSMRAERKAGRYKMNTIMDSKRFAVGAFIEQTSKVCEIDDDPHVLLGGRFSMVFNHHLNVGFAGYGLVSPTDWIPNDDLPGEFLLFGYGGLMIEPVFSPQSVVHFSIPMLLGAGGYGTRDDDFNTYEEGDAFWVFEPGLNLDVNVARFFKIALGGSYRFVTNGIQDNLNLDELSGPNANLSFQLGWF